MFPAHLLVKTQEKFPHIVTRLQAIWKDKFATEQYLNSLMISDRVNRQGFPKEIIAEIFAMSRALANEDHKPLEIVKTPEYKIGARGIDDLPLG